MTRRAIHIECQFGFMFDDIVQTAQLAEQTGYHALWASDHLFWDADSTHRPCLEPWTLLTALAPLTTTLRLGSHVTCNAFRHPSMLAKTVACLDTISQGRVDCGIGAGWNELECRAYGIPFPVDWHPHRSIERGGADSQTTLVAGPRHVFAVSTIGLTTRSARPNPLNTRCPYGSAAKASSGCCAWLRRKQTAGIWYWGVLCQRFNTSWTCCSVTVTRWDATRRRLINPCLSTHTCVTMSRHFAGCKPNRPGNLGRTASRPSSGRDS